MVRTLLRITAVAISVFLMFTNPSIGQISRNASGNQKTLTCEDIEKIKPTPIELWCLEKVERGIFSDQSSCLTNGQSTYIEERKAIAAELKYCRTKSLAEKIF